MFSGRDLGLHVGERQQVVDPSHGMTRDDPGEHVAQVGLRIDAVHFAGLCRPPNYAERFWKQAPFARACGPSSGHCPSSIRHSLASYSA